MACLCLDRSERNGEEYEGKKVSIYTSDVDDAFFNRKNSLFKRERYIFFDGGTLRCHEQDYPTLCKTD